MLASQYGISECVGRGRVFLSATSTGQKGFPFRCIWPLERNKVGVPTSLEVYADRFFGEPVEPRASAVPYIRFKSALAYSVLPDHLMKPVQDIEILFKGVTVYGVYGREEVSVHSAPVHHAPDQIGFLLPGGQQILARDDR